MACSAACSNVKPTATSGPSAVGADLAGISFAPGSAHAGWLVAAVHHAGMEGQAMHVAAGTAWPPHTTNAKPSSIMISTIAAHSKALAAPQHASIAHAAGALAALPHATPPVPRWLRNRGIGRHQSADPPLVCVSPGVAVSSCCRHLRKTSVIPLVLCPQSPS